MASDMSAFSQPRIGRSRPGPMPQTPTGMEYLGLVAIAVIVLAYAVVSRRLHSSVSAAMVFVAGGVLASDALLGWIDPTIDNGTVRLIAEATLTVVLFSDASRIDLRALRGELMVPMRLLAIGLPLTIVAGAVVGVAVLGELLLVEAVLLGIVLAPTDAALGQAVVTDPRVPSRVRQGLNVESGLNDGICVPLLLIAIAVAAAEEGSIGGLGAAVRLVVEEIGFGVVGGVRPGWPPPRPSASGSGDGWSTRSGSRPSRSRGPGWPTGWRSARRQRVHRCVRRRRRVRRSSSRDGE